MSSKKGKKIRKKGRMDFIIDKVEPVPGKENVFHFEMRPDSRVWELVEENGKEAWYNKIDKILIPMEVFEKAVKTMTGIPIVTSDVQVEDIEKYVNKSKDRLKKDIKKGK